MALITFHVLFFHCFHVPFLRPGQCCGLENFSCLMSRRDLFTASKKVAVERIWWQNGFTRLVWLGGIIIYLKSGGTLRTPISCWSPFCLRHWGHHGLAMWPTPQSIWEASVLDRWASIRCHLTRSHIRWRQGEEEDRERGTIACQKVAEGSHGLSGWSEEAQRPSN